MDKKCAWCGTEFIIMENEKVYCSDNCRDKRKAYINKYNKIHKNQIIIQRKKYYKENCEKIKQKAKQWSFQNKEKESQNSKNYYIKNKKYLLKYQKDYRTNKKNKIKIKERNLKYKKNKRKTNIHFRLYESLSARIRSGLKQQVLIKNYTQKESYTKKVLGCSFKQLQTHLEKQFKIGMTWDNYGEWHIDHIIPCASFDLTDPEQQKKCFHYTNLQPLWAEDNLKKGAKYE